MTERLGQAALDIVPVFSRDFGHKLEQGAPGGMLSAGSAGGRAGGSTVTPLGAR